MIEHPFIFIHPKIEELKKEIEPIREKIMTHQLYQNIHQLEDIQIFMSFHIFAVWDFMSLLKSLQQKLTRVTIPWLPTTDPLSRRLINQIVLTEESDIDEKGYPISHFELYLKAMEECGADTSLITAMMNSITQNKPFPTIINNMILPPAVYTFLKNTWDLIDKAPIHEVAAVFAFAREGLIPDMFVAMTDRIKNEFPEKLHTFFYYLERHIEEDVDHALMAYHMLSSLCRDDENKWQDASQAIKEALEARLTLWDGALESIQNKG